MTSDAGKPFSVESKTISNTIMWTENILSVFQDENAFFRFIRLCVDVAYVSVKEYRNLIKNLISLIC